MNYFIYKLVRKHFLQSILMQSFFKTEYFFIIWKWWKKISKIIKVDKIEFFFSWLTGKNPGGIGPPGIPSFGGICPSGDGAGPAFWNYFKNLIFSFQLSIFSTSYCLFHLDTPSRSLKTSYVTTAISGSLQTTFISFLVLFHWILNNYVSPKLESSSFWHLRNIFLKLQ